MDYFYTHLPLSEKIVGRTRKSTIIFFRDFVVALAMAGIIAGLYLGLDLPLTTLRWIVLGAVLLLLLFVLNSYVKIITTNLVITTHKFMTKEDLVTIRVTETLLDNVDDVQVEYKGPIRRMMNVGDIVVRTRSTEKKYKNMARPDIFAAVLNGQAAKVKDKRLGIVRVAFGVDNRPPAASDGKESPAPAKQVKKKAA